MFAFATKIVRLNGAARVAQIRRISNSQKNFERQLYEPISPHDLHRAGDQCDQIWRFIEFWASF